MTTRRPPEQIETLVNRILTSRQFAHADILKRILRYLVEHASDPVAPKEYDIAVRAMGRQESFEPRTDPIVRVSVGSIRKRLLAFFATEGTAEPVRMEIPLGQYRVVFTDATVSARVAERESSALMRFWQPYFTGAALNLVVYTEPLFFRDSQGRYIRDWAINNPSDIGALQSSFPASDTAGFQPTFHYLSAGEMHCLLSLTRMFHELGLPVETRNSRNAGWSELSRSNLILLGSPRTNQFLKSLQGDDPLIVHSDYIEERPTGAAYRGSRYRDGSLERMTEHAVVTRRPGLVEGRWVTMIAANHGRAIEGAGHLLTLEDRVEEILQRTVGSGPLPGTLQLLMRVDTIDSDEEVTTVECVAHHVRNPKALP